ncbi:methyl-accepting chemotaxis protein [Alkalicoccobacillus plakortidis]|uniref:Methyl-accepting chemotaxis protein n=1 Tax=Alkalicoccobacillus plakortidis TaxID=444060 RepID=A0ABT0XJF2_9BACI|nr:methyl-accepting chemotaxis protein [Alkalicoccobacillus plakortidis]MCM2676037.1 methyl-accepting chemotaxis protein [Alkalicoccobacillus plakortidis]
MKSVRGKLLLIFTAIVTLFIAFTSYSIWNTYQTNQHIEEIRLSQLPLLSAKEQMAFNVAERLALSRGYLLFDDEKYLERFKAISADSKELEDTVLLHSYEEKLIEAIDQAKEWEDVLTFQVFGLMTDGEYELAARIMDERSTPIANEIMETFHTLAADEREKINESIEVVVASGERLQMISIVIASTVLLIILWIFFRISAMISNPLTLLAKEANLIADGDLRGEPLRSNSADEISVVTHSFNQMRHALKKLIGSTASMAKDVSTTADKLSSSSLSTEDSAHEMTASLQALTAMAELNSKLTTRSLTQTKGVAESVVTINEAAATATAAAGQMDNQAKSGQKLIQQAMNQTATIEETVLHAAQTMERLDKRTDEIGQILSVLTEVSDQTGLLALNASIEAARAGKHGYGFAVVATEVQKLSEQSKSSASKIEKLITSIQEETKKAVVEIETGRTEVEEGTMLMNQVVDSFDQIIATVRKVYTQMEGVSASTDSISSDIKELHTQIGSVNNASLEHVKQAEVATRLTEEQLRIIREMKNAANLLAAHSRGLEKGLIKFQLT